jgi:hypothetical protein
MLLRFVELCFDNIQYLFTIVYDKDRKKRKGNRNFRNTLYINKNRLALSYLNIICDIKVADHKLNNSRLNYLVRRVTLLSEYTTILYLFDFICLISHCAICSFH